MKEKLVFTVVTIEEDIIHDTFSTTDSDEADEKFVEWAKQYGIEITDENKSDYLEDGYCRISNASVCLTSYFVKI